MGEAVDPVRSRIMRAIRGRDTGLEMRVRRHLHGLGYRYFVHRKGLPGRPDLAFPRRRKAVFLHGCFWHAHEGCPKARQPRTRPGFWGPKLARNRARDAAVEAALRAAGWDVLTVWECELSADEDAVRRRIAMFLGPPGRSPADRGAARANPRQVRAAPVGTEEASGPVASAESAA